MRYPPPFWLLALTLVCCLQNFSSGSWFVQWFGEFQLWSPFHTLVWTTFNHRGRQQFVKPLGPPTNKINKLCIGHFAPALFLRLLEAMSSMMLTWGKGAQKEYDYSNQRETNRFSVYTTPLNLIWNSSGQIGPIRSLCLHFFSDWTFILIIRLILGSM